MNCSSRYAKIFAEQSLQIYFFAEEALMPAYILKRATYYSENFYSALSCNVKYADWYFAVLVSNSFNSYCLHPVNC